MSAQPETPRLDLRGIRCPLTFVRTRIALDRLPRGQRLEVMLDLGEPAESVPRSCQEDGDMVHSVSPYQPGVVLLVVSRPPEPAG